MGSPSGQYGRLWVAKEGAPGQKAAMSTTNGLRPYYENFMMRPVKEVSRYSENRGGIQFDYTDFPYSSIGVTGEMRFALRYSGVHAAMLGHAMGNLVSTGTVSPFTHTVDMGGAGRFNALTFLHHMPMSTSTNFSELQALGTKIGQMRLSQSTNQPVVICDLSLIGMSGDWASAVTNPATLPPDSGGYSPDEPIAISPHVATVGGFEFKILGRNGSAKNLALESWSLELNNKPEQTSIITNKVRKSEPTRSDVREVTGSFTTEQDLNIDELNRIFGYTYQDAGEDFYLVWKYIDPAAIATNSLTITVSQAYITQPERGTTGTGAQRRTFNFAAHAQGSLAAWNTAYPLQIIITNGRKLPAGSTPFVTYGEYVTGAGT